MIEKNLKELLESHVLLSDGAMGTMLHGQGIGFDKCFDELNLTDPELILNIHAAYLQAGSDMIQTNTFGANHFKLARHGLEDNWGEINQQDFNLARYSNDLRP